MSHLTPLRRTLFRLTLTTLLASAGLAWGPHRALAFDVDRTESGIPLHFSHMPLVVYLHATAQGTLTAAQEEQALQAAIATWNQVPGTRIQLAYGGLVTDKPLFDVYVTFDAHYTPIGGDVPAGTRRFAGADGSLTRAEILLNAKQFKWTTKSGTLATATADLQGVLTHQLGHALGLGHSRHADAAMYFYKTTAAGRVLSPDDAQGARFAYAASPKAEGDACDACTTDGDCAQGVCLAWPDGYRHCVRPCSSSDDCAVGTSCGSYASGQACLPNDGHCHADAASAGLGQACASDLACGDVRFCQTGGSQGFCTAPCPCNPGRCVEFSTGGLCLAAGKRSFGQACTVPSDCASGWCLASLTGTGRCTAPCAGRGNPCSKEGTCSAQGACELPGTLPLGWPCASGFDCAEGSCLEVSGAKFARICTKPCSVASDCPAGTGCGKIGSDPYCLPGGPPAIEGPCLTPGACGSKMVCDTSSIDGVGACRALCAPYGDDLDCPAGDRCVWVGDRSASGGACRGVVGGGVAGVACSRDAACRVDLVCAGASASSAVCRPDCELSSGAGCASGQVCAHLGTAWDAAGRGACADAEGVLVEVAQGAAKGSNFAAIAIDRPSIVAAAAFVAPAPKAVTEPAPSGCQAHARPAAGFWSLLGALCLCVLPRRRRS